MERVPGFVMARSVLAPRLLTKPFMLLGSDLSYMGPQCYPATKP
jgi:hypothetical protein